MLFGFVSLETADLEDLGKQPLPLDAASYPVTGLCFFCSVPLFFLPAISASWKMWQDVFISKISDWLILHLLKPYSESLDHTLDQVKSQVANNGRD